MGNVTFATVRQIASAMPGVEETTSSRGFGIKVGGKLMVCPAIHKSAEPNSLLVRIDQDQREALIADAPDTYYVTDHYVNYPAVLVRLSMVTVEALRDLLQASWKFVSGNTAPKRRRTLPR
jgi:hypothetical protein